MTLYRTTELKKLITLLLAFSLTPAFGWDNNDIDRAWRAEQSERLQQLTSQDRFAELYIHYRLAMIALNNDDKKTAKASLETIKDTLKKSYQTQDEAALYSAALGLSITLKPWQAAFIAGDAEDALAYSLEISKEHAPTLMVKGIALHNTPSLLGGDKAKALEYFDKALTIYQQTEAWGLEDAWLWKAKTLYKLDRIADAESTLQDLRDQYPDFKEAQNLNLVDL